MAKLTLCKQSKTHIGATRRGTGGIKAKTSQCHLGGMMLR